MPFCWAKPACFDFFPYKLQGRILSTRGDGPHDAKLTKLTNCATMLGQSHFAEPNRHVLTFFIQFLLPGSHTEHQWSCSPSLCKADTVHKLCKNSGPKPFWWAKPACFHFFSSNYNFSRSRTKHRWSCSYWCKSSQSSQSFNPKLQNWDKRTKQRTYIHVNEAFCTMMRTEGLHNFQVPPLSPVHWAIALTYDPESNQTWHTNGCFPVLNPVA
jgi:hypothetical protein